MAKWELAPSLVQLRKEIKSAFPGRNTGLDGSIGDVAHAKRVSEHNPDSQGIVRAIDIDVRRSGKYDQSIAKTILDSVIGDPRVHYAIHRGHIYSRTYGWSMRKFGGVAHNDWVHVSLRNNSSNRATRQELEQAANNTSPWGLKVSSKPAPKPPAVESPKSFYKSDGRLQSGDRGKLVEKLQSVLVAQYPKYAEWVKGDGKLLVIDGYFGKQTELWVREFQRRSKIKVDGIVGPDTIKKLGITL